MRKIILSVVLCLLAAGACAKNYALKPFNSLFVRGNMVVKVRRSDRNYVKAYLSSDLKPLFQVAQLKGSVFVQMNPFKKIRLTKPVHVTVYYTTPLVRITAIQGAHLSIGQVSQKAVKIGGSGHAVLKAIHPGKVQNLSVTLNRNSIADLSVLQPKQCHLTIGKESRLSSRCR